MAQENLHPTWPHGIFIPGLQPKMSNFMEKVQKWLIKHKPGDAAEQISCQIKTACSGGKTHLLPSWLEKEEENLPPVSIPSKDTHKAFTFCRSCPGSGIQSLLVPSQPAQHSSSSLGSHNAWKSLRAGIKLQKAAAALSETAPGEKGTAWWVWSPQSCILLHP